MVSQLNKKNKSVLIIGGGMAGMTAAVALANQGINVHLVEKKGNLGGHASSWACMATDTCQHCSGCLSSETAYKTTQFANLNTYLGYDILKIDKDQNIYTVHITGEVEQTIKADKIIVMHKGHVRETGTHNELLKLDGIYAKLYRLQFDEKVSA